ncbi:MAG TPA: tRNA pseudouridine(55) synthase TruB [Rubricoccaceae bacterium]|nr:tRNA pseudouridine(55) synthase TruB [Rubricoccaceae bacterium]
MTAPEVPVYGAGDALPDPLEAGAFLVDKPPRLTSFAVVRRVRRALGIKKVGHAGTLDPMATGLLVVLVGRVATRAQDAFMGLPKTYTGTLRLGETTPSFDADTPVDVRVPADHVTDADLEAVRARFEGEITQVPPVFSAIKVGGQRLYQKARKGMEVEVPPRRVAIYRLAWTGRRGADVDFEVECSKGTYVRSLAHDVGQALGVGAHLVALRRTAIGPYRVEDAFALDTLAPRPQPEAT